MDRDDVDAERSSSFDADRLSSVDADRSSSFDSDRSSSFDAERSSSVDSDRSSSVDSDRSSSFDADRSSSFDAERSSSFDAERSSSVDSDRSSSVDSDSSSSFDSDRSELPASIPHSDVGGSGRESRQPRTRPSRRCCLCTALDPGGGGHIRTPAAGSCIDAALHVRALGRPCSSFDSDMAERAHRLTRIWQSGLVV